MSSEVRIIPILLLKYPNQKLFQLAKRYHQPRLRVVVPKIIINYIYSIEKLYLLQNKCRQVGIKI